MQSQVFDEMKLNKSREENPQNIFGRKMPPALLERAPNSTKHFIPEVLFFFGFFPSWPSQNSIRIQSKPDLLHNF
jgi:hypothetical protein